MRRREFITLLGGASGRVAARGAHAAARRRRLSGFSIPERLRWWQPGCVDFDRA